MNRTLRLQVGPLDNGRQGYPLELFDLASTERLAPPDGEAPELLPADALDVQAIRRTFAATTSLPAHLLAVGEQLFAALNRGSVGQTLRNLRQPPATTQTLLDVQDPTLKDLPWELMASKNFLFFARTPGMARYQQGTPRADTSDPWPLRLLVVVGAVAQDPAVQWEAEVRRIKTDLMPFRHSIDVEVQKGLPRDPLDALVALLRDFQPHVLHFIGHSGLSGTSGLPALFIQGANPLDLDSIAVANILDEADACPRFVFLNACHTANAAPSLRMADAFIGEGARAALSMQGDIRGDLAGQFAADVYKRLWNGEHADVATATARAALWVKTPPQTWAFPVLSFSTAPDDVFPKATAPEDAAQLKARAQQIERCRVFQEVSLFSGRAQERRSIRTAFRPIDRERRPSRVLIVTGQAGWGKSHLVKRSLECLALGGQNIRYVPIAGRGSYGFVDLLVDMLSPHPESSAVTISEEVFYHFKWDVKHILDEGATRTWDGTRIDDPIVFDANAHKAEDPVKAILTVFGSALRQASAVRPLVIVLDQFRGANQELIISPELFRNFLWPSVCEPLLADEFPRVSLALIFWPTDATDVFHVDDYISANQWLKIDDLDSGDFVELAEELLGYADDTRLPGLSLLRGAVANMLKEGRAGSTAQALERLRTLAYVSYLKADMDGIVGRSL